MEEKITIVISDDNEAITNFMKSYIENNNKYEIVGISSDAKTEIELIDKFKPNVVITDIKKDNSWIGLDIIKKYKNEEYCPVFFVVSASIDMYYNKMKELGISHYLWKPFTEENFMNQLRNIYYEIFPTEIAVVQNQINNYNSNNFIINIFKKIRKRLGL